MIFEKIILPETHKEVYLEAYMPKYPGKKKRKALIISSMITSIKKYLIIS